MSATAPTKGEREAYARDAFAVSSFLSADVEIDRLLQCYTRDPVDEVLVEALSASVLVFYLRPFKGKPPFRLDKAIVPVQFEELHSGLEIQRDKVIAHRDANLPPATWVGPNDFGFIFDGKTIMPRIYLGMLDPARAIELKKLIHLLREILEPRIVSFYQKHLVPPPSSGHYLISLKESPANWFSKLPG